MVHAHCTCQLQYLIAQAYSPEKMPLFYILYIYPLPCLREVKYPQTVTNILETFMDRNPHPALLLLNHTLLCCSSTTPCSAAPQPHPLLLIFAGWILTVKTTNIKQLPSIWLINNLLMEKFTQLFFFICTNFINIFISFQESNEVPCNHIL